MAVIINEFELMPEQSQAPQQPAPGNAPEQEEQRLLAPADIERVVRYYQARRERLTAD